MTNDTYRINDLATLAGETLTDTGGIDWLDAVGTGFDETTITLSWVVQNGEATEANARLWVANNARSLFVNGFIENVRGSAVSDFITGNTGANILYGDQAATGAGASDTIFGDTGRDTIFGGAGNDDINGAEDADRIGGDAGNDTISGAGGRDTVEGGAGPDSLSGGSDVGDTISYRTSAGGVEITLEAGTFATVSGGHGTGDRVFGFTDVMGSDLRDVIFEDATSGTIQQVNRFQGFGGNDQISTAGNNDLAFGGDGFDLIYGGAGRDSLYGGAAGDQLIGNAGGDLLVGGAGADRFLYFGAGDSTANADGRDRIADFSRGQGDSINLTAVDAKAGVAGNQAFTFVGGSGFSAAGQLRIVDAGAYLVAQGNTDNDAQAEFAIRVDGPANLFAGDFIL